MWTSWKTRTNKVYCRAEVTASGDGQHVHLLCNDLKRDEHILQQLWSLSFHWLFLYLPNSARGWAVLDVLIEAKQMEPNNDSQVSTYTKRLDSPKTSFTPVCRLCPGCARWRPQRTARYPSGAADCSAPTRSDRTEEASRIDSDTRTSSIKHCVTCFFFSQCLCRPTSSSNTSLPSTVRKTRSTTVPSVHRSSFSRQSYR